MWFSVTPFKSVIRPLGNLLDLLPQTNAKEVLRTSEVTADTTYEQLKRSKPEQLALFRAYYKACSTSASPGTTEQTAWEAAVKAGVRYQRYILTDNTIECDVARFTVAHKSGPISYLLAKQDALTFEPVAVISDPGAKASQPVYLGRYSALSGRLPLAFFCSESPPSHNTPVTATPATSREATGAGAPGAAPAAGGAAGAGSKRAASGAAESPAAGPGPSSSKKARVEAAAAAAGPGPGSRAGAKQPAAAGRQVTPPGTKAPGAKVSGGPAAAHTPSNELEGRQVLVPFAQWPGWQPEEGEVRPPRGFRGTVASLRPPHAFVNVMSVHQNGRTGAMTCKWGIEEVRKWLVPAGQEMDAKTYTASLHG